MSGREVEGTVDGVNFGLEEILETTAFCEA